MKKTILIIILAINTCCCLSKEKAESVCLHTDSTTDKTINKEILGIGDEMENFKLYDYNDSVHNLSEFRGHYIVLEFSAIGCGPCQAIKPILEIFYNKYKDSMKMVTISEDPVYLWKERPMGEVSWYEWNDHDYALKIRRKYGIKAIPTFVVINPSGIIVAVCYGAKSLFENMDKYLQNEDNDNTINH